MKKTEEVNPDYIAWVEDYYKDKKSVDVYPIGMNEIIDNLFDINLLIDFVKKQSVDWEFVSKEEYQSVFPPKKMRYQRNKRKAKSLLEMSAASLNAEKHILDKQMQDAVERIDHLTGIIKQRINDRTK